MLLDWLNYSFMVRALLAGVLIGVAAPLLGTFLVARRSSLLTDTLSHTALAGVGLGILLGVSPLITATAVSIAAAVGIERIISRGKLGTEAVHALFLSGGLALAIIFTSFSQSSISFESFLFGSIATVNSTDLYWLAGTTALLALGVFAFWWPLVNLSFHEELAEASGSPVVGLKLGLAFVSAITVSLALKIVGGLLIGALMVVPVLTAVQLCHSFKSTVGVAIAFAEGAILLGLLFSYYWDVPSGSAIVLLTLLFFLITLSLKKNG